MRQWKLDRNIDGRTYKVNALELRIKIDSPAVYNFSKISMYLPEIRIAYIITRSIDKKFICALSIRNSNYGLSRYFIVKDYRHRISRRFPIC